VTSGSLKSGPTLMQPLNATPIDTTIDALTRRKRLDVAGFIA